MADYHAVLKRTLSGFPDPKPQLRTKLYDRARATIRRQLENRSPPVTGDALELEMEKLEKAVFDIERGFDPSYPEPASSAQPATPEPVVETQPEPPAPPPVPEPAASGAVETPPQPETPEPEPLQPTEPAAPNAAPKTFAEAITTGTASRTRSTDEPAMPESQTAAAPEPAPAAMAPPVPADAPLAAPPAHEQPNAPPAPDHLAYDAPPPAYDPAAQHQPDYGAPPPQAATPTVHDEAVDQWAQEFMAHQPHQETAPQYAPIDPALQPVQNYHPGHDPAYGQPHAAPPPPPPPAQFDSPFGPSHDDTLAIPNAPGFGSGGTKPPRRKRRFLKWIVLLFMLAVIGGAGYYSWMNKELVLAQIGMEDLFENPTRPKPVKTITITPDPEPETSGELLSPTKLDNRLGSNGENQEPAKPEAVQSPALQNLTPVQNPAANENAPRAGGLPVAQNAILYEEGATPTENSVDAGRVIWSVVQEEPATGLPPEPAIRARIEISPRNVVLLMTIKRNADKALPASHLIELVFAVPDDFAGGSIGQINRFVLKQSEQGRGENLIGVPARIADGIFLIALNNLDEAKVKNENLLQTGDWIDIPMQYRTGRRALMTIEKGVPGAKIFEEVFAAWSKL